MLFSKLKQKLKQKKKKNYVKNPLNGIVIVVIKGQAKVTVNIEP